MNSGFVQKRECLSFQEGEVSLSLTYIKKNSSSLSRNYFFLRDVMLGELYNTLFRFLQPRPRSYWECLQKLISAQFLEKEIQEGLQYFEQKKWIDDHKFAQFLLEGTQSYRAMGSYGIRHKLLEKHVDRNIIDEVLQEYGDQFLEDGKTLLEKQLHRFTRYEGWQRKEKMRAYLYQRGFSQNEIEKILRNR